MNTPSGPGSRRRALVAGKLVISYLGFAALVTEIATLVERRVFDPLNFFSYFTVQCNSLICLTLLLSALATAAGVRSQALEVARGLSTVMILVVGIGFAVLLSGLEGVALTAVPWDNVVLHYLVPVAAVLDYLLDRPSTRPGFRQSLSWLLFPLAYLGYSLTRGALTGWYPYPFLNPADGGYASVAAVSLGLLVLGIALIWAVTRVPGSGSPPTGSPAG